MVATKHPQSNQRSRRDTKTSYKVFAQRHFSGWFALLQSLYFNSVTIFRKSTGDASVLNVPSCVLYRVDPPDDEQQACSKHVEAYYSNKLIENSASCCFMLYGICQYVTQPRDIRNKD
jgi:hypothetical protein